VTMVDLPTPRRITQRTTLVPPVSPASARKGLAPDVQTSYAVGMAIRRAPGTVRDAILRAFETPPRELTTGEIRARVVAAIGEVPASSVRSYLNINTPTVFERTKLGTYKLRK
jgi:hypothetical protein